MTPRSPISTLLWAALLLLALGTRPATAQDVTVLFWVADTLATSYSANILITNDGPTPIQPWTMTFDLDTRITGLDHARWTADGTHHTVTGLGWTYRINPGASVWFSFEGAHEGIINPPTGCTFNGQACTFVIPGTDGETTGSGQVDVEFVLTSIAYADRAFVARIMLINGTDDVVEDWSMRFDFNAQITVLWNADWSPSGGGYLVSPQNWNRVIVPGDTVQFGFQGKYGTTFQPPTNCMLSGNPCAFSVLASNEAEAATLPPDAFTLSSAFPNPFSSRTRTTFRTALAQYVTVDLFDLQGRRLRHLYDGFLRAHADHPLIIEAGDLPGGVYLLRVRGSHGRTATRPLILTR